MEFHRDLLLRSGFWAIQEDALPVFLCVLCGLERVERAGERYMGIRVKEVKEVQKFREFKEWSLK
jgi:hypothetical protein